MSRTKLLTAVMALAMCAPLVHADISLGFMGLGGSSAQEGNCHMMATNTVTASFVGLRHLAVQRVDQQQPDTVQVAVFQVTSNLDYRRFNRFADGMLTPGMQYTIAMNKELPGQPAEYVDTIASLQPGDAVVMRVDHLYLLNGQAGESIRTCARLARSQAPAVAAPVQQPVAQIPAAIPTQQPTASPAPLPIPGAAPQQGRFGVQMSTRGFSITTDANGQMQTVQTSSEYDPTTGQMKKRMFINGVEVDPETRQPLPTLAPANPAPAPAPVDEAQAQQEADEDEENDTIVEHNNNPVVQPGDKPVQNPATMPEITPAPQDLESLLEPSESF